MATQRKRDETFQQRMLFRDNDLGSPMHDRIMMWVDRHAVEVVSKVTQAGAEWSTESISHARSIAAGILEREGAAGPAGASLGGLGDPPERPAQLVNVTGKEWEHLLTDGRSGALVAAVDMMISFTRKTLVITNLPGWEFGASGIDIVEHLLLNGAKTPRWEIITRREVVCVEVKSGVRSVGEVLRQVKGYKEMLERRPGPRKWYAVVSADDRYADLFAEQGIAFVRATAA